MIRSRHTDAGDAPLDPAIAAELEALEAALRGEAIEDDELATLVRDVRAQAPVMPRELREGLREDVEAGFPRGGFTRPFGRGRGGKTAQPRRRSFAFGGGIAVAAVLAVFVAGAVVTGGSNDSATLSDMAPVSAPARQGKPFDDLEATSGKLDRQTDLPEAAQLDSTAEELRASPKSPSVTLQSAPSSSAATAGGSLNQTPSTSATGRRRVEQAVDLTVRVKSGELGDASGKVADITRQAGGFVADSQVSMRTRGAGSATFSLQVASSKLDAAIDRLSDLGTVTSQNRSSTDITSSFDSARQRLADAKAVRAALLRSLAKAEGSGEIASLRSRIADNRRTIAGIESQQLRLERRTDLTTIALTLRAPSSGAADTDDDGQWSIGDAAGDAGQLLGTVAGVLLVGAAGLLPVALVAALLWAAFRLRRRRLRDGALGA